MRQRKIISYFVFCCKDVVHLLQFFMNNYFLRFSIVYLQSILNRYFFSSLYCIVMHVSELSSNFKSLAHWEVNFKSIKKFHLRDIQECEYVVK